MTIKNPIAQPINPVCDENSCTTDPTPRTKDVVPASNSRGKLRIEVVSDVICPWCYIGKRKLDKAIAKVAERLSVEVVWRPFQLNPTMPHEGLNRREYRSAKFGSWQKSQQMDEGVTAAGAAEGITFHFERIDRT